MATYCKQIIPDNRYFLPIIRDEKIMNILLNGNANRISLADESVQCVVTSPPYWGLRKYAGDQDQIWGGDPNCKHEWQMQTRKGMSGGKSDIQESNVGSWHKPSKNAYCNKCGAWYGELGLEPTPEQYIANMIAVFREVRRVLRSDGVVFLNLGDSYWANRQSTGQVWDDGNLSKSYMARAGGKEHNILKPKDLVGIPWRVALALQADGWWLRSDIIWHKTNPMPESVRDRPTKSHEYVFLLTKSARYFYDYEAVKEDAVHGGKKNRRSVWTISTKPYSGAHFATYPPDLVEPCIKAGTSEKGCCPVCGAPWERVMSKIKTIGRRDKGSNYNNEALLRHDPGIWHGRAGEIEKIIIGWQPTCDHEADPVPCIVLDPFVGSGTTLLVAEQLGRDGIGMDLSLDYLVDQASIRLGLNSKNLPETHTHKNMIVPGRSPHSFHKERVKNE